jgi:L,D-transpeptidase catalytic domain
MRSVVHAVLLGSLVAALALSAASSQAAAAPSGFPAAGELVVPSARVRAHPDPDSRVVWKMSQLRPDRQLQIVLAVAASTGRDGMRWYELSLAGRPNGRRGWVKADLVDVSPVRRRIVVWIGARRIEVRRISDGTVLLDGIVAVGKPGAETPLGRDFYVQKGFVPTDPFFGTFALETSAYSKLSDWPGGGIVGIHGTSRPDLLGQAVSHGCIRVSNAVANRLRTLAPPGTPIDVLP